MFNLPVVVIEALKNINVQCDASCLSKRLEDVGDHLTRKSTDHLPLQSQVDVCKRSSRDIDHSP